MGDTSVVRSAFDGIKRSRGMTYTEIAMRLGVAQNSVYKWFAAGRLPYTELTGKTAYAKKLSALSGIPVQRFIDEIREHVQSSVDAA